MLTNVEEPSSIIKLIKFISILTSQILKNFPHVIDGASFSILTGQFFYSITTSFFTMYRHMIQLSNSSKNSNLCLGAVIRLVVKRSFIAQCQSVDPAISPMLNQMLKFGIDTVSFPSVIQGFIKLAHEMINCVDENILKAYVKCYFKGID